MKKGIKLWFLNLLWRAQFKKELFTGRKGRHCEECVCGRCFYCGDFYCPVEEEPYSKMVWRFENVWFIKKLNKWRTSI